MAMAAQQRMAAAAAAAAAAATGPPGSAGGSLPYVCNWVSGADYCGRRFPNSEELLVHLKTHTNLSTSDPRTLSMLNSSLLASSLASTTGAATTTSAESIMSFSHLGGGHPGASNSLSASRFHPYGRPTPPGVPTPPSLASLGYASPYVSLYSSLFARPPLL